MAAAAHPRGLPGAHTRRAAVYAAPVEPVVVGGGAADFGTTLLGAPSTADVQDLIASGTYRVKQLAQAYADFSPTWVQKDSAAFVDWTNDWTNFQNRWNTALKSAQSALGAFSLTPANWSDGTADYTALMKALRASYPPDGGPTVKGDFDDLNARLTAASGKSADYSQMPQPKAKDADMALYKATASADVVAQVTGQEKPQFQGMGGLAKAWTWVGNHPRTVMGVGVVLLGGVVLGYVLPIVSMAAKGLKGAALLAA